MSEVEKLKIIEDNRIERLELGLREVRDSTIVMSKDIHTMSQSITSIAESIKVLADVQSNLKVIEERIESRHIQNKSDFKTVHSRIDKVAGNQAKVVWLVLGSVVASIMSLILIK